MGILLVPRFPVQAGKVLAVWETDSPDPQGSSPGSYTGRCWKSIPQGSTLFNRVQDLLKMYTAGVHSW